VQRQAFLGAIGPDEVRGQAVDALIVGAREIADAGALDLDHAGALVGELTGTKRCRDRLFQRNDGDAGQWQGFVHGRSLTIKMSVAAPGCARPRRKRSGWWRLAPPDTGGSRGTCAR